MTTDFHSSVFDIIESIAKFADTLYAKYFLTFFMPSKSAILAVLTAVTATARYIWSEFEKQSARKKEQAIKAADEIDNFYDNNAVWLSTRFIDYENFTIEKSDLSSLESNMKADDIWNCLVCHSDADLMHAREAAGLGFEFTRDELKIRDLFDRFLTKLERMEKLIAKGVISKNDFRDFFSYWLQLMSERPQPGDRISHLTDERRMILWRYIRGYEYTGVIRLFKLYGRAYPAGAAAEKAFKPR
jgi:hypothetical protein